MEQHGKKLTSTFKKKFTHENGLHFGISHKKMFHCLEFCAQKVNVLELRTQKSPHFGISHTKRSTYWNFALQKGHIREFHIPKKTFLNCAHMQIISTF